MMNDTTAADRIIELAMKWQNKVEWELAYKAADSFRKERDHANQDWATARRMHHAGQQGEMLEMFRHDAERCDELSEQSHRQVIDAHQELLDLTNLVRTHAPKLLELVPQPNFFFDAPDADLSQRLRALRRLEGEVRAETRVEPPKQSIPVVTLGDNPQIVLDGNAVALKYDAAVWLKALIDCGDWMSGPEYRTKHGSENDRPDRWRKDLPPKVRDRIETDRRKGSRWRLA